MPYDVKRFIFTVSLCAMLAVNPVLATVPTNDEELGTTHDVYVESTLNQATNGIAGVSYVNRMVNAAGNAADAAEAHAAAAGAHALSAAQSADEAHKVLANKVNIDQGADKKNLAMVTDDKGTVYPGYISTDMIEKPDQTCYVNASGIRICSYENQVLISDDDGNAKWEQVANAIPDGAVTLDKISSMYSADGGGPVTGFLYGNGSGNGDVEIFAVPGGDPALIGWDNGAPIAVVASGSGGVLKVDGAGVDKSIEFAQITTDDIANGAVTTDKISSFLSSGLGYQTGVLLVDGIGGAEWGQVGSDAIADGAVTSDKIADGVLSGKVNIDQGADKKNLAMVTDDKGTVYPGYVDTDMIADGAVTAGKIADGAVTSGTIAAGAVTFGKFEGYQGRNYDPITGKLLIGDGNFFGWGWIYPAMITSPTGDSLQTGLSGLAIVSDGKGNTYWGQVSKYGIEDEAVTSAKIAARVVTTDKMSSAGQSAGVALVADGNGGVKWGEVGSAGIADGAVTSGTIANGEVTAEKLSAGIPDGFSTTGFLAYTGSADDEVGKMGWRKVETNDIADDAVTSDKIANGAVTSAKIADRSVVARDLALDRTLDLQPTTGVLLGLNSDQDLGKVFGITQNYIVPGAVPISKIGVGEYYDHHLGQTITGAVNNDVMVVSNGEAAWSKIKPENTEGVVGMVPVGGEGATTYISFWIE
ncbi:MAG: hypothetical protein J6R52_02735 [Alphaproteobacteria bacterium]|nr:hypothetical protein [Alphaproteobacteria bacterium]